MPEFIPKILPILLYSLPLAQSEAKESIYWLYGEYLQESPDFIKWAPDVLRMAASSFKTETVQVKHQMLNFAIKFKSTSVESSMTSQMIDSLFDYLYQLAKFDENYDVRDKARFISALLKGYTSHLSFILHSKKPNCNYKPLDSGFYKENEFLLGSLSHLTGKLVNGYVSLSDFSLQPIKTVRVLEKKDEISFNSNVHSNVHSNLESNLESVQSNKTNQGMNLDEFLASSESESESDEDSEDETDEEVDSQDEIDQ